MSASCMCITTQRKRIVAEKWCVALHQTGMVLSLRRDVIYSKTTKKSAAKQACSACATGEHSARANLRQDQNLTGEFFTGLLGHCSCCRKHKFHEGIVFWGRNICNTLVAAVYGRGEENREIYIPHVVFNAPVGEDPVVISQRRLVIGKTGMIGLPLC